MKSSVERDSGSRHAFDKAVSEGKNNTNIYENTRIAGESRVNSERYQEYTMIVTGYSKNQLAPRVDIEAAA